VNLKKKTEKGLTYYGDSRTISQNVKDQYFRQTPAKDGAETPRLPAKSILHVTQLGLATAVPNDRAAASQGREAVVSVLPTPYYSRDGITIYHGDCRDILPLLGPVDLVLTDPPYGIRKADWDGDFPTWWLEDAARLAPAMGLMPGIWNLLSCPREVGRLKYRWTLAAYLANGMTRGLIGFGNWIPCLVYTADGTSAYQQDGDCRRFAVGTEAMPEHPCPKPYNVMRWLVSRLPGDLILDPFMGSGTTLRAAKDLGRRAIGIEIEEKYCEIAVRRLSQEVLPL